MKRKILVMLFLLIFALNSFAIFSVGLLAGNYSMSFGSIVGIGAEVEIPITPIPFLKSKIQALTGSYDQINLFAVYLQEAFQIPLTGIYGGGEVGYINGKFKIPDEIPDLGGTYINGGVVVYGLFGGYEHEIFPLTKVFGEVAYNIIPLSTVQKEIKDENILVVKLGGRIGL